MKNFLLVLGAIVIIILMALLYFNGREAEKELHRQRIEYEDSLRQHELYQAGIRLELDQAKAEKRRADSTAEASNARYKAESADLRSKLVRARTHRVDTLIQTNPELAYFVNMYDSLYRHAALRVDSLEFEARIAKQLHQSIVEKSDSLLAAKESETAYLRAEVDKRDKQLLKKKNFWARLKNIGKDVGIFGLGFVLGKASG